MIAVLQIYLSEFQKFPYSGDAMLDKWTNMLRAASLPPARGGVLIPAARFLLRIKPRYARVTRQPTEVAGAPTGLGSDARGVAP